MKTELMKAALVSTAVGLVLVACGSDPKPEPAVSTPVPSATPEPIASAPPPAASAAPADPGPPAKSAKETECEGLLDEANHTLDAERISVDKDCKKDADCVAIKGRACNFNCANAAIPKALEKDWNAKVTKVKDVECKKWSDNECSKLSKWTPPPCQDRKVACENKHCVLKEPAASSATPATSASAATPAKKK